MYKNMCRLDGGRFEGPLDHVGERCLVQPPGLGSLSLFSFDAANWAAFSFFLWVGPPVCVFLVVVVVVWDLKLILTILKVYSSILRCATSTMPVLQVTAVNPPSAHPTEGPSLFVSRWRLAWRFVFNVMNVYGNSGMPDKCTHLGMTHVPKLERPHTNNNPSRLFLLLSQYSPMPTTRRGRENS